MSTDRVPFGRGPPIVAAVPRLLVYVGLGAGSLVAALVLARPALAAFGAPLLLIAVVAVCLGRPPTVRIASVRLTPERTIVGDALGLELDLQVDPPAGRIDVMVELRGPASVDGPSPRRAAWSFLDAGRPRCRADLTTHDWGRVVASSAVMRAYGPLGLVHWTWLVPLHVSARVLPPPERLRSLLDPPPRAASGTHASRARGHGLDFAELRPLSQGDRLTDVNWRASARRGALDPARLLVNVRHPDRAGDVVLLLDAFADDAQERAPWLARAGQAAWSLARAHLQTHDRVGLVSFGGTTSWVGIRGGDRAAYALLDRLLAVRPASAVAHRTLDWLPPGVLPPGAAIVAVTPLHTTTLIDALIALRQRGRRVAALVVETADLLPSDPALAGARAFWALEVDRRVDLLHRAGIATSRWRPGDGLGPPVALLARVAGRAGVGRS